MEELGEVFALWQGADFALEVGDVRFDVGWNCRTLEVVGSRHSSAHFSISDFDNVSNLELEARDVDNSSVHQDVTVVDHLSSLEDCLCIAESPNCRSKSELEQAKEIEAGVAAHSLCLFEGIGELLLQHVVVAADNLLRQQLFAVLRLSSGLKVRAVLSSWVGTLGCRALCPAPNVIADGSANIGFSSSVGRH